MPDDRTVGSDRLALRRAALLLALRDGDVVRAARSWSRLRVHAAALEPHEAAAGRASRREMGRALRIARERRTMVHPAPDRERPPMRREVALPAGLPGWWRPAAIALACAGLALALLPLAPAVSPARRYVLSSPLPIASALGVSRAGGRGRTEATLTPVAVVTPAPRASSAAATASPRASASLAATSSPAPKVSPSPTASPTARPSPSAPLVAPTQLPASSSTPPPGVTPQPLAPGYSRLIVLVVDATTTEPVAGACIVIGVPDCSPSRPHTNTAGLWWIDFPTGQMAGLQWPVRIVKDGYATLAVVVTTSGTSQQFVAPLPPIR